jgi:hypothetical protein
MDIFKELDLTVTRAEPQVWVRRLVIYKTTESDPGIIRDVRLSKGLNIVWAEEPEDDDPSAEISGHSAGKTSFCRLLRYALGETTFATKGNAELIRQSFPKGYIAAEIIVRGTVWAVLRPIGNGKASYLRENGTIEELVSERGQPVYQDDFARKLGLDRLLDDMATGAIVQTNEPILWRHLLAWCTRDQEARFQNIHEWRSNRSESEWQQFRFPKAGPLFVMRAVLGLILPDELRSEEELAGLLRRQTDLEKRLEDLKREPTHRVNLYEGQLRKKLKTQWPDEASIDALPFRSGDLLPDLDRRVPDAVKLIEASITQSQIKLDELQEDIDEVRAYIRSLENQQTQLDVLFGLNESAAVELDEGLSQRGKERGLFAKNREAMCILGGVLYRECSYVQKRQQVLQITQGQDARSMEQAEAKRAEEQGRVAQAREEAAKEIERLKAELTDFQDRRRDLTDDIRGNQARLRELRFVHQELGSWWYKRKGDDSDPDLIQCQTDLKAVNDKIAATEEALTELIRQHETHRALLASIFSGAVRSVLPSGTYDGRVGLDNRELAFRITHGQAMSGEAVETLSVLLADIAVLIYNTTSSNCCLPGFLVHDSPREADLGARIYRSFIRFIAKQQAHFGAPDNCPFQYILTTTTPPPKELRSDEWVKLPLNAGKVAELLFRRNIADPPTDGLPGTQAELFDPPDEDEGAV